MLIEDQRPRDRHGPDEQLAAAGYLEGCRLQVLDRNWKEADGRHCPPHDISCVRQRQLRLHATAGMTARGKRFAQLRTGIASAWSGTSDYSAEHLRGVSRP
jgi:hypothetical protein